MNESLNREALEFEVDRNIINHVIASQSSSVEDALTELVQNSLDAGATKCHIWLDENWFKVCDNGTGFNSKEEIVEYFGKFGTPHDHEDSMRFGRFRMGRGQIMNLASTTWRSNEFEMVVDIKTKGLTYELRSGHDKVPGCEIRGIWNEPISSKWNPIKKTVHFLKEKMKYLFSIEVYLNDELISLAPDTKWDIDTDTFFFKELPKNGLSVFNLGVRVRSFKPETFRDLSGVVISKKHLSLNTSRDQVLKGCEVWDEIAKELRKFKPIKVKKNNLTHAEMSSFIANVFEGFVPWSSFFDVKCFLVLNRKRFSYDELCECKGWCFAPDSSNDNDEIIADKLWQQHQVVVLSLIPFYDIPGEIMDFLTQLKWYVQQDIHSSNYKKEQRLSFFRRGGSFGSFSKLVAQQDDTVLDDNELSPEELIAIKAFRTTAKYCYTNISKWSTKQTRMALTRQIFVGDSSDKLGWTDGANFIALERSLLKEMQYGVMGCEKVVTVYFHELCHEKGLSDVHDEAFYERFHNLICFDGGTRGAARHSPLSHFVHHLNKTHYLKLVGAKQKVSTHIAKTLPVKQREEWLDLKKNKMVVPEEDKTHSYNRYCYQFVRQGFSYVRVYASMNVYEKEILELNKLSDEQFLSRIEREGLIKQIVKTLKVDSVKGVELLARGESNFVIDVDLEKNEWWV